MPELPEVEVVRSGLDSLVRGATITDAQIFRDSCVRLTPGGPGEFADAVIGGRIDEVARRGKFLWLPLVGDDAEGAFSFSAHLGMSGQFRVFEGEPPERHSHCRARFTLERGQERLTLDFLDQRTFGYLHAEELTRTADGLPGGQGTVRRLLPQSVAHIGRDALDPHLDLMAVTRRLRAGARGIKQVLLDQTVMSGVGNIYADEALWRARLHPQRPAHTLSAAAARGLVAHAQEVMAAALAQGGTSFDALYVNVNGESGYFSRSLDAYGRTGEPCSRCGTAIRREMIGGRSTHWCHRCQRAYRALVTRD